MREESVFDDILQRKKAFLDYNKKVKKVKNWDFSKGELVHGFGQKFENVPSFYFWQNARGKCL